MPICVNAPRWFRNFYQHSTMAAHITMSCQCLKQCCCFGVGLFFVKKQNIFVLSNCLLQYRLSQAATFWPLIIKLLWRCILQFLRNNWDYFSTTGYVKAVSGLSGYCWNILTLMMTSSNGNIFRVTGHLCGEFTGLRWIPRTKASDAEFWCFLWSVSN